MESLKTAFSEQFRFTPVEEDLRMLEEVPAIETNAVRAGAFDCGNHCVECCYYDVFERDLRYYRKLLEETGFQPIEQKEERENVFSFYRKGEIFVSVLYTQYNRAVKILAEQNGNAQYYPWTKNDTLPNRFPILVTQIGAEYFEDGRPSDGTENTFDEGFSYCIRLQDGRFVLIDGGYPWGTVDIRMLWNVLQKQNVLGGKPVIAMWIFTHAHPDHVGGYEVFERLYGGQYVLEMIVHNNAAVGDPCMADPCGYHEKFVSILASDPTPQIKAHPGMQFRFGDILLETLYSFELFMPRVGLSYNQYSLVFRLSLYGKTILFLSDFADDSLFGDHLLNKMYGGNLRSDIVQLAHHGLGGGGSLTLYREVQAKAVLWPVSKWHYTHHTLGEQERNQLFKEMKDVFLAGSTMTVLEMNPEGITAALYANWQDYEAEKAQFSRKICE